MPVTFLAHQAPLFPIRRRFAVDGVAFIAGSIAPDLAAATTNTAPHYILWGIPTWRDGHQWNQQLEWCLLVGLLLAFLVRRLLAPALAPHLPAGGGWNLRDLAVLAERRYRWWVIVASVLAGSVTHVLLDAVTHESRPGSLAVGALDAPLLSVGGRTLRIAVALQVLVSVVLAFYAYRGLRAEARRRWGAGDRPLANHREATPAPPDNVVLALLAAVAVLAAALAVTQTERGVKTVAMTWVWLSLFGAVLVALGVRARRWWSRRIRVAADAA